MRYSLFVCLFSCLLLTSCGSNSLEDFREEGEGITRSLIEELKEIRTREDLMQAIPRLEHLFDNLVDTIIAAEDYKEKNSRADSLELTKENHELSDQLRIELNRIYSLEGGRQVIEKCQEQALHRLDAFEKRLAKQKKL